MAIYAVESPTYQPAMRIISTISNADPMVVTTSFDHDYSSGLIVRLILADGYTMKEANNLIGVITVLTSDTFSLPFDSTYFTTFASPVSFPDTYQRAQVIPVGEQGYLYESATQNVL